MSPSSYDAIVVGARCAGSPTAMLLARKGYRVLVVDRATFPSDTISTHIVHPPGVAALERGACSTGCRDGLPADRHVRVRLRPVHDLRVARDARCAGRVRPRRTVLDKLLVDAASEAGAEVREGFTVEEVVVEDGRVTGIRGHGKGGADRHRARARRDRSRRPALARRQAVHPSSTTRSRRSWPATTPTGAGCRCDGASTATSAPTAAWRRGRRTTA